MIRLFNDWYLTADTHCFELKTWDGETMRKGKNGKLSPAFGNLKYYFADLNTLIRKIFFIAIREKVGDGYELQTLDDLKQMVRESQELVENLMENIIPADLQR